MREIFILIALFLARTVAAQEIPSPVAEALAAAGMGPAHLAFAVVPVRGDAAGLLHHADMAVQPASTMKLVTTVTALDLLGPNYRAKTELLAEGPIRNGELRGRIFLRGYADPDLDVAVLWQLLYRLRAQGVRTLRGNVILDRGYFAPARADLGLPPFDEAPEWQYNVIPDALNLNGGLLKYLIESDERRIRVRTDPPLFGVKLATRMGLSTTTCKDWEKDWQSPSTVVSPRTHRVSVTLHGGFPRNCSAQADLQLFDRDQLANRLIRQLWADMGGRLRGRVVAGETPPAARLIARHESRPLAEVIRGMNKSSDNPLTRLLFLSIGANATAAEKARHATTGAAAAARVQDWFAARGISTSGLQLDNGSGLSRDERITARQMAEMLKHAYAQPYAPELLGSLPLVGVDGTMRNRLKASRAAGQARIKSGTLKNVAAIAGFVPDAQQNLWVVVAMINHDKAQEGRAALDALIDWVASRSGAPVVAAPVASEN